MEAGVDVLSASDGIVLGARDGLPDRVFSDADAGVIAGKECGNGVLIMRKDGWRFQYCHLMNGSVRVSKGQDVTAGMAIGSVGLSGMTYFPHLHLTIRDQAGRVIDPFDARQQDESCRLRDRRSLWREDIAYQPGGIVSYGFADHAPKYAAVLAGRDDAPLDQSAPAVVFWAHFFGLQKGDRIELGLFGPDGRQLSAQTHRLTSIQEFDYHAVGKRAEGRWPAGEYRGVAQLFRGNGAIGSVEHRITIR